jgi:hypothetical protein
MRTPANVSRLKERGCVLLVAAESVERLGEHDVHAVAEREGHHVLEAGTHHVRPRGRMIGALVRDRPLLPLQALAAEPEET